MEWKTSKFSVEYIGSRTHPLFEYPNTTNTRRVERLSRDWMTNTNIVNLNNKTSFPFASWIWKHGSYFADNVQFFHDVNKAKKMIRISYAMDNTLFMYDICQKIVSACCNSLLHLKGTDYNITKFIQILLCALYLHDYFFGILQRRVFQICFPNLS